jgi:hypothetical protein
MEHVFEILRAIIMTYNKHNIIGYKCHLYDGVNPFIKTKACYMLYFQKDSTDTLEALHTPFGKIKLYNSIITEDVVIYKTIYDEILSCIKGVFISRDILIIKQVNDVSIPYPLIMTNAEYTPHQIQDLFVPTSMITTSEVYNSEIERLVSLGVIEDEFGILNKINTEQEYYDAIDDIFKLKMYMSEDSTYFIKTSIFKNKYKHILGLLLLTDTKIRGLTY